MTILRFHKRHRFELAVYFLQKMEEDENGLYDIGYSDMIVNVYSDYGWELAKSQLDVHQIWSKPSFHGEADYEFEIVDEYIDNQKT